VLIMGGDQVYPDSSRANYRDRLLFPYSLAFPDTDAGTAHTPVFLIPGNHDWYDGLVMFLGMFCKKEDAKLGNWRARQQRSYFAIKLTKDWWVWGIDIQLSENIDQPQAEYFQLVASKMAPGANVILCTAVPGWLTADELDEAGAFGAMGYVAWIAPKAKKNLAVPLVLSGDTHHYSRSEHVADVPTSNIISVKVESSHLLNLPSFGLSIHPFTPPQKTAARRNSAKLTPIEKSDYSLRSALMMCSGRAVGREAIASLVFLIEFLSDNEHLSALEVSDPDGSPALGGADHGAEHQFQHRLLAEGVGNDLEPSSLLDEQARRKRTSSARSSGDARRPSIRSQSDWRARIDAGILFSMVTKAALGANLAIPVNAQQLRHVTPQRISRFARESVSYSLYERCTPN
jgi:Calcineurin-like phosphoesterase